jgi:hypothetical protein
VQEVLDNMFKNFYSTYSRVIFDLQRSATVLIDRILAFVSDSARPAAVAEVAEFAILDDDMTSIRPGERFEDFTEILSLIGSLINIQDGILILAHKSVQDFFVTERERNDLIYAVNLLDGGAEIYIARRCLHYLTFSQPPGREIAEARKFKDLNMRHLTKLLADYSLLDYTASRWPYHVRSKELQEKFVKEMEATLSLTVEPTLWKAWLMLQRADIWENWVH